jgi:hypothetical protein
MVAWLGRIGCGDALMAAICAAPKPMAATHIAIATARNTGFRFSRNTQAAAAVASDIPSGGGGSLRSAK